MAVNKRKVLEAARKYAQKGAKQKALKEYQTLLKLDPRDAKLRLEIGDAHRRWGENEEAIGYYTKVADQYQQDGFDARAVAVYKQILNLDPKRYVAYVSLSELYQRMGLDAEAVGALQSAADGYHKEGKKREALELLRKMAQLDPTNTTSRLKVAELLQAEGLTDDAAQEFEAVAEELARQGEPGQSEKVYERVLEVQPGRADVLILLARNAIAMRKPERAEGYARRAVDASADEASLEVLCDVYKALERTEDLVDVTRRLAKLYRDRGDDDMARTIMQRLPSVGSAGLGADVSDLGHARDETDDALIEDDELLDDELLVDDGTDVFELGAQDDLGGVAPGDLGAGATAPDLGDDGLGDGLEDELILADETEPDTLVPDDDTPLPQGDPEQLLAEASVYLRYGKTDQAIASLRAVVADEPGHRTALEKLGEALCATGDESGAVAMWTTAAERAREEGDGEGFDVLRSRIAELDAAAADALSPIDASDDADVDRDDALFSDADVSEVASEVGDSALADEIEIDLDLDDDTTDEVSTPGATSDGDNSTTTAQQVRADLEEAEFFFQQGMYDEAGEVYERILRIAPNHPSALLRIGEIAASRGADPTRVPATKADPGATLSGSDIADEDTHSELDVAADEADGIEIDVDLDDFEHADEGGVDDTEPDLAASSGAEPALDASELAAALDAVRKPAKPAAAPDPATEVPVAPAIAAAPEPAPVAAAEPTAPPLAAAASADDTFDLAAELTDALADDDPNDASRDGSLAGTEEEAFASLFEDFKRGVSQTLDDGDYETRYDLAIAYKEMGLLDDAIAAFQVCVASPSRALDSLQLMAQCQLEVGRPNDAIGHLEQALSSPDVPNARRAGLFLDLGRAFMESGQYDRARTTYENASELDPRFPGLDDAVAELLERINETSAARAEREAAASDEAFETFDDLVADAQAEEAATQAASDAESEAPASGFESFDDVIEEAEQVLADADVELAEPDDAPVDAADEDVAIEPEPAVEPAPKKKAKKKISFV
ncbi:MAG: tetratricopeptide repeat protein [Myxococcales bacterium]|nr:tetratricopeptide repeat protein [Myxococcales bacterium]